MAEAWIIANPKASYRDAAMMFGITHNAIRSRIVNDHGSLSEARGGPVPGADREPKRVVKAVRRCMRCRESANIEPGFRMCTCCRSAVAKLHDGGV